MRNTDLDFTGWNVPPQWHPSLSGQKQLFLQDERASVDDSGVHHGLIYELFTTGRDLPGAHETAQAILWDIE